MILTLVRHATLVLEYAGRRLLVDPMLGEQGSAPAVENTPNQLRGEGFADLRPVDGTIDLLGISIARTDGRHGTGEIGEQMAPVSGFVLSAPDEPTLYIAGDTIWCDEVDAALKEHAPGVVVVNAGGARFNVGDPITMTPADVMAVAEGTPEETLVVAVHMDAINNCVDTRAALGAATSEPRILIPADGEALGLG